ncbi:MAG TPA: hypothetical protein VGP08_23590 [Pyrinomonadaceae bacterium]|jgi:hypothetical protein|nr:hypothetical protein [Pyrinomonadaceae bacterium]
MSTEFHNRLVAVLHLIHGFVAAASAAGVFLSVSILIGFKAALERWLFPAGDAGSDPEFWLYAFAVVAVIIYVLLALLFTIPAIVGGFGMLRHKAWARKLVLVSAVVAALDFPFGTAIAVYTLWFLLGSGWSLQRAENSYMARP